MKGFSLPKSKRTIEDLLTYFQHVEEKTQTILPKEKRRYAMYLRKSTDDELKQVRSLEDQKTECLELARRKLDIVIPDEDIFEESASAKISGNRPIFDNLLMGFKTGKYHGLIAWSPDRISRNMKEAGEVIEMIDLEQIQDLHFKTYQFDNTPNGKMLLGILFATSKQYSDKLAVDVSRGITGTIKDGKYVGQSKRGYYVDKGTGYFLPDGKNWELLRQAVFMRLNDGKTNQEIADFLNDAGVTMRKDQDSEYKQVKFDKKRVGSLFDDTFYFGLYKYGDNLANLTDLYDFLPLFTPDEYVQLNQKLAKDFNKEYVGKAVNAKRLDYGLLRGRVVCDYCDTIMQFQHNEIRRGKNKGKWLISFYCRNKECERHKNRELKKSVRAKYIMAHIEFVLRNCTKKSKEAYKLHLDGLNARLAQERAIAKRKLNEAKSSLRVNEKQLMKYQQFQVDNPNDYKKHHKGKLELYENFVGIAEHNITKNQEQLDKLNKPLPTEKEFYELVNSYLETLLNTTDLVEQDAICSLLVSNLRVKNDCVSVIKLNPPYSLMVDLSKISSGRGSRT